MGSVMVELGLGERKKLGHWMFLLFCGACLFLGLLKICATGWFGSAIERAASNQVGSRPYPYGCYIRVHIFFCVCLRKITWLHIY